MVNLGCKLFFLFGESGSSCIFLRCTVNNDIRNNINIYVNKYKSLTCHKSFKMCVSLHTQHTKHLNRNRCQV